MSHAAQAYSRTSETAPPREIEAQALLKAARQLRDVQTNWAGPDKNMHKALLFNRRLWSIFMSAAETNDNPQPVEVRQNIANIAVFDTEDEVIVRANATEYGLCAYVVTANGARQLRLGRALDYGMVAINRVKITGSPVPFGGWKQSGLGREGARHGMEAFTELKYLCLDTTA